jgi:hypothetical protein
MDRGRALVLSACAMLDVEIPASCFRLMAANENKTPVALRITVQLGFSYLSMLGRR